MKTIGRKEYRYNGLEYENEWHIKIKYQREIEEKKARKVRK